MILNLPPSVQLYVATGSTDMRKSFDLSRELEGYRGYLQVDGYGPRRALYAKPSAARSTAWPTPGRLRRALSAEQSFRGRRAAGRFLGRPR